MKSVSVAAVTALVMICPPPAFASVDYAYPEYVLHTIEGLCNGDRLFAAWSTWDRVGQPRGLKDVQVGTKRLSSAELGLIQSRFMDKRIVRVSIVGCRRTQQGDNRVWFRAESEHPDPTTGTLPDVVSFFVRDGNLEFHERAPSD